MALFLLCPNLGWIQGQIIFTENSLHYLKEQGWIKRWKTRSDKKGRPVWNYALAVPVPEIMTSIEKQKKTEANNQLALIKKMRSYI